MFTISLFLPFYIINLYHHPYIILCSIIYKIYKKINLILFQVVLIQIAYLFLKLHKVAELRHAFGACHGSHPRRSIIRADHVKSALAVWDHKGVAVSIRTEVWNILDFIGLRKGRLLETAQEMFSSFMQTEKPDLIVATSPFVKIGNHTNIQDNFCLHMLKGKAPKYILFNKDGTDYIHYKCKKGHEDDISLENYLLKSKKTIRFSII